MSHAAGTVIACDESGYESDMLVGTPTDVFAHASVRMDVAVAEALMDHLRERIGSPARHYKANHVLRTRSRPVLLWLLSPAGPLSGNAHVFLIAKAFFLLDRLITLLAAPSAPGHPGPDADPDLDPSALAAALYREGREVFGPQPWREFLAASNHLLRRRHRPDSPAPVDAFAAAVAGLQPAGGSPAVHAAVRLLRRSRPATLRLRQRLLADPDAVPVLDPLAPAVLRAVARAGDRASVQIVHDRQKTLTDARIARLRHPGGDEADPRRASWSLRLVDSRTDARVQVADVLAGVARRVASDDLAGRGDRELTGLLRPYVDPCSIWPDDRWREPVVTTGEV